MNLNDRFMVESDDHHCCTCGAEVRPEYQQLHNEWHTEQDELIRKTKRDMDDLVYGPCAEDE